MKILISSGHSQDCRGAAGPEPWGLDEVDEARKVVEKVADFLRAAGGVEVETFHDNTSQSQDQNLATITAWHNRDGGNHDYDISVHFNAYTVTSGGRGPEVYYGSPYAMADKLSSAIYETGDFVTDRGPKDGSHLYVVSNTYAPCCLIETCFVDAQDDCEKYRANFDAICETIASTLAGVEQIEEPPEPIEPPEIEEPPPELTDKNYVEMRTAAQGGVQVLINGTTIHGTFVEGQPVVDLTLIGHGDVAMLINGEMFHSKTEAPPFPETGIPANQRGIITTVFGGAADNEYSAYGPYDDDGNGPYLDDEDDYCSLPWTVPDAGRDGTALVRVINAANGKSIRCWVGDKGPWFVDDPYGAPGNAGARPEAETLFLAGEPCPRGPNEGTIPNGAGIDISPHAADVLGIDGKGLVDWQFEEPETIA